MTHHKKMHLVDWLDDLCVRFIINLPTEELMSAERIGFQIEEAQWYYEDFIRPLDPEIPSLNLRNFYQLIFHRCPLLSSWPPEARIQAYDAFIQYKTIVPVRGAIMLNTEMDEILLVKGWKKGANWSFPRGKANQNEPDLTCAVREVYEETGYDLAAAGLVGKEEEMKSLEVQIRGQELKMYVFRGVPPDTHFEPRTRKEISKISWHKLAELPMVKRSKQQQQGGYGEELAVNANKYYMVAPFLGPLKKWIIQQKKRDQAMQSSQLKAIIHTNPTPVEHMALAQENFDEQTGDESKAQDHLSRLLASLRNSSPGIQAIKPNIVIAPISSKLVPRSEDLLALFKGSATANTTVVTPAAEMHTRQSAGVAMSKNKDSHSLEVRNPTRTVLAGAQTPAVLSTQLRFGQAHHESEKEHDAITHLSHPQISINSPAPTSLLFTDSSAHNAVAPLASTLPTPQLSTQSSTLLGIFKSSKKQLPTQSHTHIPPRQQDFDLPMLPSPTVQHPTNKMERNKLPAQSSHQSTLLGLFKSTENPRLSSADAASQVVELSASHTPSRSPTNQTHAVTGTLSPALAAPTTSHGRRNQEQPMDSSSKAFFATINGPLASPKFGISQQEDLDIKSKSVSSMIPSGSTKKRNAPQERNRITTKEQRVDKATQQKAVVVPQIHGTNAVAGTPKVAYKPQILRRPVLSAKLTDVPPRLSQVPSVSTSTQSVDLPGPEKKTPSAHQQSLLSLFSTSSKLPVLSAVSDSVDQPNHVTSSSRGPQTRDDTLTERLTTKFDHRAILQRQLSADILPDYIHHPTSMTQGSRQSQTGKKYFAPDRMPQFSAGESEQPSRSMSIASVSTTTPVQREFLLDFLEEMVKSG